jgi:uncharacterized low-complexity protein
MKKPVLLATVGTAFLVSTVSLVGGCASTQAKPDAAPTSASAASTASKPADGSCGGDKKKEGSCGADHKDKKAGEGSCGEGSCGANKPK